jgi:hypothetical protein
MSSLQSESNNSLSSRINNNSLEEMYHKITKMILKMQDYERTDSIDSLINSVMTQESKLKSE